MATTPLQEAGFDKNYHRVMPEGGYNITPQPSNQVGGVIGKRGPLYLGNNLFTMDGNKARITVDDGADKRILIGKREDGTYGIDIASVGYDVHTAYEGEMDLTSKARDDWTQWNPANFVYNSAVRIDISNYTSTDFFQKGDKIKLVQDATTKYFYIYNVQSGYINVHGGSDYAFTNNAITEFYSSRLANPSGHPIVFNFEPTVTATETMTVTPTVADMYFWMIGNVVHMTGTLVDMTLGVSASYGIIASLPFGPSANYTSVEHIGPGEDNDLDEVIYFTVALTQLEFYRANLVNWTLGSEVASISFDVAYFI